MKMWTEGRVAMALALLALGAALRYLVKYLMASLVLLSFWEA